MLLVVDLVDFSSQILLRKGHGYYSIGDLEKFGK